MSRFTSGRFRILCICVAGVFAALLAGLVAYRARPESLPSYRQVRDGYAGSETVLLDRHGEIIHELRADRRARRLEWVALKDISPALQAAVIYAEDRRFYHHDGVSWPSLGGVAVGMLGGSGLRGASTITMQLAAQLDENLRPRSARRTLVQKLRQITEARALEKKWSKAEILEAYLNLVTWRGELQGMAAASQGLFRKEPQGLNDLESLILAALIRSPNAAPDQVYARACALAEGMKLQAEPHSILGRVTEALSRPYLLRPQVALAPHVALRLLDEYRERTGAPPRVLVSTLDARLQSFAAETLPRHILALKSQNMHDGAALVVDNKSGEVLAYVGNIGIESSARYVDGIRSMRQAGSTLKPFLYGRTFDRRLLTPVSLLDDSPTDIPVGAGVYRPRNYDNVFHGTVTARTALASSLNVPAVKTLTLAGVDDFVEELHRFGFRGLQPADFYGPSLALGSADITLWDLVGAYRALANRGVWGSLRLSFEEPPGEARQVLSPEASFLVSDILSDRESRSETFSLESPLATRFWTAVKTGTSKDMRDNWCVGYSDRYTVGVWAGNFSGDPMWNVSGVTGAAPVWVEIMNWLHRDGTSRAPAPPPGVVERVVQIVDSGQRRREWFIRGTETSVVREAEIRTDARIVYPASGTVIALDPDIPMDDQKVFFEAAPADEGMQWLLDGRPFCSAAGVILWTPVKGKHTLGLADESGRVRDTVDFEVRGNLAAAR